MAHPRLSRAKWRSPRRRAQPLRRQARRVPPRPPLFPPPRHDLLRDSDLRAAIADFGADTTNWSRSRAAALARYVILVCAPDVQDNHWSIIELWPGGADARLRKASCGWEELS